MQREHYFLRDILVKSYAINSTREYFPSDLPLGTIVYGLDLDVKLNEIESFVYNIKYLKGYVFITT